MPGYKRELTPGVWSLEIQLPGKDARGKYRRASKRFRGTKAAAERELQRWYAEAHAGRVAPASTMTVEDLCRMYVDHTDAQIERGELHRSYSRYRDGIIFRWIAPALRDPDTDTPRLGETKVNRVGPADIDVIKHAAADEGLAPKSINNIINMISKIFRFAITELHIVQSNPADYVSRVHADTEESRGYTPEEFDRILAGIMSLPDDQQNYRVAFLLALFAGLRLSEICGLEVNDFDPSTGRMHIHQARQYSPGRGVLTDKPKSRAGSRYVTLPPEVAAEVTRLIGMQDAQAEKLGSYYRQTPYLLKRSRWYHPYIPGDPLRPTAVSRRFKELLDDVGVDIGGRKPFHALRHTHASLLARIGATPEDVREQLGHAQLTTTLDIYTHVFSDRETKIAGALSAVLSKDAGEK